MTTLILALTVLHSCVHGSWWREKWENKKYGSLNHHRKNSRGGKKFHSRSGNQRLPLAMKLPAWLPHSSTHSLGWGKTHRLFSYNGKAQPFMTWSLFPWCCHNTENKLILFLRLEVGMLQSIEIPQSAFHPVTHSLCIYHSKQKIQCMPLSMRPKRDSG